MKLFSLSLVLLVCAGPRLAHAQANDGDARASARGLAEEGADLYDAGQYTAALDRATRAEELYHAPSNVLLIAQAQEALGQLAAAAETYEKLVAEPLPPSAPHAFLKAQEDGKQRLSALLARVPSILVTVNGGPVTEGVAVSVDGRPVTSHAVAERFDPGPHKVEVSAPGFIPFEQTVTLPSRGGVVVVASVLSPLTGAAAGPTAAAAQPTAVASPSPDAPRPQPGLHAPAYVAFATGGAGAIAGAITGILSLSKVHDLREACPGNRCPPSEQGEIHSAQLLGTTSTIGFAVGGVGIAAGTVLLFIHPSGGQAPESTRGSIAPWIGPGSAGVTGRF